MPSKAKIRKPKKQAKLHEIGDTPSSANAERSILGGLLTNPEFYPTIRGKLEPRHFSLESHRRIFQAIVRLAENSQDFDPHALIADLESRGEMDDLGGREFVGSLIDGVVPSKAGIETNVSQIFNTHILRRAIALADGVMNDAQAPTANANELVDKCVTAYSGLRDEVQASTVPRPVQFPKGGESALINDLEEFFGERIFLPDGVALVLALWVINTWVFDVFETTPYLLLESVAPRCGKTTVLRLLGELSSEPISSCSISEAALFRIIEMKRPTLLLDEAECLAGKSPKADALRSILNAGYKRGGAVHRWDADNDSLQTFDTYSPKAIAAIGGLTGSLLDRCIVITMRRRPKSISLKSCRSRQIQKIVNDLRRRLESYASTRRPALIQLCEEEPAEGYFPALGDRDAELWLPLLSHTRLASPDLESRAFNVALQLSEFKQDYQVDEGTLGKARELKAVLQTYPHHRFSPGDLVPLLDTNETWRASLVPGGSDREFAVAIGRFLRTFGVGYRRIQGKTFYGRLETIAALSAILPDDSVSTATTATTATYDLKCMANEASRGAYAAD